MKNRPCKRAFRMLDNLIVIAIIQGFHLKQIVYVTFGHVQVHFPELFSFQTLEILMN